jgi:hypothetical protein
MLVCWAKAPLLVPSIEVFPWCSNGRWMLRCEDGAWDWHWEWCQPYDDHRHSRHRHSIIMITKRETCLLQEFSRGDKTPSNPSRWRGNRDLGLGKYHRLTDLTVSTRLSCPHTQSGPRGNNRLFTKMSTILFWDLWFDLQPQCNCVLSNICRNLVGCVLLSCFFYPFLWSVVHVRSRIGQGQAFRVSIQ